MSYEKYYDDFLKDIKALEEGRPLRQGRSLFSIKNQTGSAVLYFRLTDWGRIVREETRRRVRDKGLRSGVYFRTVGKMTALLEVIVHPTLDYTLELTFLPEIVSALKNTQSQLEIVRFLPPDLPDFIKVYTSNGFELLPPNGHEPLNSERKRVRVLRLKV